MVKQSLVLLSGMVSDEASWDNQIPALSDIADCLPLVPFGETIEAMAEDVLARAPQSFALAGHSMGGYVALAVQRHAPERVLRLALMNSAADTDNETQRAGRLAVIDFVEAKGYDALIERLLPVLLAEPAAKDEKITRQLEAMLRRADSGRFMREQHAAMQRPDAIPALAALNVPFLIVAGAMDRTVPPALSAQAAAAAPAAKFVTLNCGHVAPAEMPEALNGLLREWLQAPVAGAAG